MVTDYTLEADGSTYKVIAYDKAGNSTACTVTVNNGHTSGEAVKKNEVAATCTTDGSYDSVVYCTVCGAEISRETIIVEAGGHTEGEAVKENEVAATRTANGPYDKLVISDTLT
ncbi:MAG: hypothetical protein LUF35_11900 [Lachnospiraceae bacterium]|nr:hypothetical protein [Lachnospiraceae bacterium]